LFVHLATPDWALQLWPLQSMRQLLFALLLAVFLAHLPLAIAEDRMPDSSPHEQATTSGISMDHNSHGNSSPRTDHERPGHAHVEHPEHRVIGYLVPMSFMWMLVIHWFVNHSEPSTRQAAAKTMCSGVAVCCAVLLNQAIFSSVFDVVSLVWRASIGERKQKRQADRFMQ